GGRGDDPEAAFVHRRAEGRRRSSSHPRRSGPARTPARVLHPRRHRHHGHERGVVMTSMNLDEITALDADNVMQTYGRAPVAFVRGEGTLLYDSAGGRYLDFLSGLAVTSLGHAHPVVAAAIADQAQTLLHVSNLYYNEIQPQVAEILNGLLGGGGRVFFANSGAEANECAIKLARRYRQSNG